MTDPVDRKLFDEAVQIGQDSVDKATHYLKLLGVVVVAIDQAVKLMDSGRPSDAREVLKKAHDVLEENL